jgi:hypothetical protein
MDTTKIYSYLAILKTGCSDPLDNFKLRVIQSEIDFRASFTQFMTEGNGKGANLILNDYMDLKETLSGCAKEAENPFHEQFVYSLAKTKEAIDYIKKTIKMYASDELPHTEEHITNNNEKETTTCSNINNTIYQALYNKYGSTISVKQLCEVFGVHSRTIYNWEQKGYITNINPTSDDTTSLGHKKRGEEKRYLTSDVAKSIELCRKFNEL